MRGQKVAQSGAWRRAGAGLLFVALAFIAVPACEGGDARPPAERRREQEGLRGRWNVLVRVTDGYSGGEESGASFVDTWEILGSCVSTSCPFRSSKRVREFDDGSGTIYPLPDGYTMNEDVVLDCLDENGELAAANFARVQHVYRLRPEVRRGRRVDELVGTIPFEVQQFRGCNVPDRTGRAVVLMRRA